MLKTGKPPPHTHLQVLGQRVGVGEEEQGAEDGGPHVLDVDARSVPLAHRPGEQRAEHGRPRLKACEPGVKGGERDEQVTPPEMEPRGMAGKSA